MSKQTILYQAHLDAGAKMVEFAGWKMPIHYGSQLDEHHKVRGHVGVFDVSHMGVVDITGDLATEYLRYVLANDVAKLATPGRALYSCMLNAQGGVIDDLIVYRRGEHEYRLVINAGRREQDLAWLKEQAPPFAVAITLRDDFSILAIQGPEVFDILAQVWDKELAQNIQALKPFRFIEHDNCHIARTGYTGEDGVEIILPHEQAITLWSKLIALGVQPCGLGARDTLRLEAGLNLYGHDMDEATSPLESNLAWTVAWTDDSRDFVGRQALQVQQQAGLAHKLVGLMMTTPGVLRDHQPVMIGGEQIGEITSGGFSPTLGHAIALARIPLAIELGAAVVRRGKEVSVDIVKPPFVRHGKPIHTTK